MEDIKLMNMKTIFLLIVLYMTLPLPVISQVQYGGGVNTFTSTVNSSTATLTSGSVFTGTAEDISQYSEVRVAVKSDVASATDGLSCQFSSDGTNWDNTDVYTIPAATGKIYGFGVGARYFRIVYTNGGTNQASFRLQTIFHKVRTKPSSQRPQDARTNETDMEEDLAYNMLFNGTTWDRAKNGQQAAASAQAVTLSNENVQDLSVTGQSAQTATVNNILTTSSGATATDLTGYRSFSIQIISTGTGGTFIFEGSNDNTNFQTIPTSTQLILTGTVLTAAITPTSSNLIYIGPVNFRYMRCRIATTITGGSIQAVSKFSQAPFTPMVLYVSQSTAANLNTTITGTVTANLGTGGTGATSIGKAEDAVAASGDTGPAIMALRNDLPTSNASGSGDYVVPTTDIYGNFVVKDQQRHKPTYRTAFVVAPAITATDIFQLIGSSTKTVEITKIIISGTQTTGGMVDVYIKKRSSANSGGTSSAATLVPMISTDAAATAVGAIYTANPTPGATVGDAYIESIPLSAITGITNNVVEINFGERGKAIQLSGVAQAIAINLNGVTVTGGSIKITVEFTEY